MKTIRISVGIGLVGCRREETIEVDDYATEDEIEETVREAVLEMISWSWTEARSKK